MVEMNSGIYIILSPSNRCYIGSTNNFTRRNKKHFYELNLGKHHCDGLQAAWNKYGESLKFIIIEHCAVEKLVEREQWWMDNHRSFWGRMYNSSSIAGRPEHTPEVRAKIGAAQRGRKHTREHREKVAAAGRGRKHTPETKAKMSAIMRASPERIEAFRKVGRDHIKSKDEIERIAALGRSHKGKKHTPETKAKMSKSQKARFSGDVEHAERTRRLGLRPKSAATRAKMSVKQKQSWTPERKAKYREMVREQRVREHIARINWIAPVSCASG